jgi:hypothetical protein
MSRPKYTKPYPTLKVVAPLHAWTAEAKAGGPSNATWADFEAEFRATFCLENKATTSLMHLESERYFQGRQTVDQYVDEFSDLIDLSGYSDPLAIIIKFRQGLDASTQDRIAEFGTDRPTDNDPDGWYKAARLFDLNRLVNKVFCKGDLGKLRTLHSS